MTQSLVKQPTTFSNFLSSPAIKNKIAEMVGGESSQGFITSLIASVSSNQNLMKCSHSSLLSSALVGASLNLPCSQALGYYYLVPYKETATFILGYKGLIQLALRSGQFRKINALPIKKGELKKIDLFTEEFTLEMIEDIDAREKLETVGYLAMFELLNGFRKVVFITSAQAEAHAKKYSKSFNSPIWKTEADKMFLKIALAKLLKGWAPLTNELGKALEQEEQEKPQFDITDTINTEATTVEPVQFEEQKEEVF